MTRLSPRAFHARCAAQVRQCLGGRELTVLLALQAFEASGDVQHPAIRFPSVDIHIMRGISHISTSGPGKSPPASRTSGVRAAALPSQPLAALGFPGTSVATGAPADGNPEHVFITPDEQAAAVG